MLKMLNAGIARNHPDSRIADDINRAHGSDLTRNAIIGKRHRLYGNKPKEHVKANNKKAATGRRPIGRAKTVFNVNKSQSLQPLPIEPLPLTSATNCSLMELEDKMCKWPVGNDLYCGGPVLQFRKPYCVQHGDIAQRKYEHQSSLAPSNQPGSKGPTSG